MKNYYQVLGVSETASTAEIEVAYHELRERHRRSPSRLQEIETAFRLLCKPRRRASYDQQRQASNPNLPARDDNARIGGTLQQRLAAQRRQLSEPHNITEDGHVSHMVERVDPSAPNSPAKTSKRQPSISVTGKQCCHCGKPAVDALIIRMERYHEGRPTPSGRQLKRETAQLNIPHCAACRDRINKADSFAELAGAVGACLGAWYAFSLYFDHGWAVLAKNWWMIGWVPAGGCIAYSIVRGIAAAALTAPNVESREYPQVRQMMAERWQVQIGTTAYFESQRNH